MIYMRKTKLKGIVRKVLKNTVQGGTGDETSLSSNRKLALPAYQDYSIRTKVSEGLSVAASAKVAVAETCMTDPATVPSNSSVGYSFSSSKYVSSIVIRHTCQEPWIIIRTRYTGATTDVVFSLDGSFSPGTGRVVWNCHKVAGEERHMPQSCRDNHGFP
jgi:type IV pilus assembly protein PilA